MKRLSAFLLFAIFTLAIAGVVPASAQRRTVEQNARQSREDVKKQKKMLRKSSKRQRKAAKKAAKAERRATRKANRDLQKRRGHR